MCNFELKVLDGLKKCGVDFSGKSNLKIGIAVSGGADSVSLLVSLSKIIKQFPATLNVITVNHNIRPEEETCGDASFVKDLCEKLSDEKNISCTTIEIPRGVVFEVAKERGQGIEEAARYLRYKAFDSFIEENNISYLCLAHNQNDQFETVLMRFLQGASVDSLSGIKNKRDVFIRPLLEIERSEIETYLNENGYIWRTDSTNNQIEYLRNKIRLKLIPFLDKEFGGWKSGVLTGVQKASEDSDFIANVLEDFKIDVKDEEVSFLLSDFKKQPVAIQKRILLKSLNLAGETKRIPSVFLEDVINGLSDNAKKVFHNFSISVKKEKILIKKDTKLHTEIVFFDIIEESGIYNFPFGYVNVKNTSEGLNDDKSFGGDIYINDTLYVKAVEMPFCIRSIQTGDYIETVSGEMKKVADVLTDWHVSSENRNMIPVVQLLGGSSQKIKCILGSFLGYKDWIVK